MPYEFTNLADAIRDYLEEIEELKAEDVSLEALHTAHEEVERAAKAYEEAYESAESRGFGGDLREVNRALIQVERAMAHPDGLPDRPWYRHMIYAPGVYTGYGVKTLPGVREALEESQWERARAEVSRLAGVLRSVSDRVDEARRLLDGSRN